MTGSSRVIGRAATSLGSAMGCFLAGFMLIGCAGFEESGLPGSASSMARNQMMLVRQEPPSFGSYRLASLVRIHPDLGVFLASRGAPDFLAETDNRNQEYFILYYLDERRAFACRTRPGQRAAVEFAGPYPITDREYKTLDAIRRKGVR